ncbi:MAG: lytic transglycosylase domain-containing protein [Acidobacteria bacterium]|nr:lytic transglycosylase domain-containing protein [Acidobacteriota bacterium]
MTGVLRPLCSCVPKLSVLGPAAVALAVGGIVSPSSADDLGTPRAAAASRYVRLVLEASSAYRLDPRLVDAVIRTESAYRPFAVSARGAAGLMQLMPATASRFGVVNRFDPVQNVFGGCAYLAELLAEFDLVPAIAAYNAGAGAVHRYGGIPPYAETRRFVARVLLRYLDAGGAGSVSEVEPHPSTR